jgi:cephalosporin hydroxylase
MFQRMVRQLKAKTNVMIRRPVARAYHRNWYEAGNTWMQSKWMGFPIQQMPFDLQRYQELIHGVRPRAIVQTGINQGGSLLFFAQMLDLVGDPVDDRIVVGVDVGLSAKARELTHPRIRMLEGDSTSESIVSRVGAMVGDRTPVIVSLDSDHRHGHVLRELRMYTPIVDSGGALVVEDTNLNGHPVYPSFGPGPREALEDWKRENSSHSFANIGAEDDPNWLSFHSWFKRI